MTTRFTRPAVAGLCLSFVLIGALQALYGPAVPAMRERFGISDGEVGIALSAHFIGALLGVLGTPALRRRVSNRVFLALALGTILAGSLAFAAAPLWTLALVAAFAGGVGFGWIDVGVNEFFIEAYGSEATGMLNMLHANFGIGAVLGPLLVGALPGRWYPVAFVSCAVLAALVLCTVRGVSGRGGGKTTERVARRAAVWRLGILFMVFFVLHVGVEAGTGGWETAHLVALGWTAGAAATATSGFWLAMTAVRFAVHPLARRFTAQQILLASCLVMLAGAVIAHVPALAVAGYLLVGIGVGPLFPTGLVWLTRKLPDVRGITSYVIAASMLGGVFPSLLGGAVQLWGTTMIPTSLSVLSGACLIAALAIRPRQVAALAEPYVDPVPGRSTHR